MVTPCLHTITYRDHSEAGGYLYLALRAPDDTWNGFYTDYVYPFELASVILLVAIVAAIALTLSRRKNTKYQDPAKQINIQRKDRVRMVSMATEAKPVSKAAVVEPAVTTETKAQ